MRLSESGSSSVVRPRDQSALDPGLELSLETEQSSFETALALESAMAFAARPVAIRTPSSGRLAGDQPLGALLFLGGESVIRS